MSRNAPSDDDQSSEPAADPPSDDAATERTLDVREIDGEPFGDIVEALEALPEDGTLRLINSFEPEPLYAVLRRRGFEFETTRVDAEEWHVAIEHA